MFFFRSKCDIFLYIYSVTSEYQKPMGPVKKFSFQKFPVSKSSVSEQVQMFLYMCYYNK